ncbi:MAG TPA: adenosylcobalamin-dependent ribonucleoside-diphosphate reductase [Steroidobacteraceae bacterium]|nr:adenosylcobalamin-dependent ribonucleoside-diphosphate reductase [Steroidobacteraceae bacterium]
MLSSESENLSRFIWRTRYRDPTASPPESTIADTWNRIARSVAAVEREPGQWQERFRALLASCRFLPGGRIIAGAGVARQVTLANCFVMGLIDDSITGIFEALKEGALTMQQGGGVGYDFSTLRPRGGRARTTGMIASGPVSFLHVWDAMCATILSTGARRGAMMATLRCDHPDIREFIAVKQTPGALSRFNLSVLVTDEFMRAAEQDALWPLVFPSAAAEPGANADSSRRGERIERAWSGSAKPVACEVWKIVRARDLWQSLCASAEESAEPGVLFIDRINAEDNLAYAEQLSATNPCAEEPLPPYGACNLGSLNLPAFVCDPFTRAARLDREALRDAALLAVRFLDDVIEISRFPLFRQRIEALGTRRIGLGITGLADALAMLGLRYDSQPAREMAASVMRAIRDAAYETSIDLARERGPFQRYDGARYLERPFIRRLPEAIQAGIRHHGIRNSHLLAVAPAGTISLLAGNVSSGIEPIFRLEANRRVLDVDGEYHAFRVKDRAYALWQVLNPDTASMPEAFIDLRSISWREQLLMQAALQPFVDGSISKTVALTSGVPRGAVEEIFRAAYELGLKGCTVFRESARPAILADEAQCSSEQPLAHCCDAEREAD